jgi:hypothetical protein
MLRELDEQIRDAYRHAEDCARRAKAARGRQGREDWLLLESRYVSLAQRLQPTLNHELLAKEASARQKALTGPERFATKANRS